MIHIEDFTFNSFCTRCSLVWDENGNCAIIDPGCSTADETGAVTGFIQAKGLKPSCIMLTHGHFDHIFGAASLARHYGDIPVYMNPADKVTLEQNEYFSRGFGVPAPEAFQTTDIREGSVVEVGSLHFEVLETPGHTIGGVCYLERSEKTLFSGDTLFAGTIGRTDHPGGDYDKLMESIFTKLLHLEGETKVIPGHGPCSDIATERMTNPFLMPFNEPYEE
jgi:glyoxylase-like metal-dependent hydrolase (beta-lactamase superfamily II)